MFKFVSVISKGAFYPRALGWGSFIVVFLWIGNFRVLAQQDGIFADFQTSMGGFTCRLYHAEAPKAVANFIGLATGERAWLDLPSGQFRTNPFYNGTIFHRVIADFMNQGGSPNKQGNDGPGYSFVDEFSPSLRHTNFGVLSMANSGPDSNGSQFFVTAAPTTWLNDVHTIFGQVVGGSNVVYSINHVATSGSRPVVDVVIQRVGIRRVGTAAQAFNIHAQGLPVVTNIPLAMAVSTSQATLTFSNRLNADNRLYSSTNLTSWGVEALGIETTSPIGTNTLYKPVAPSRQFYRMARVDYASTQPVPKNVLGKTVTLKLNGGVDIVISLNSSGTGAYSSNAYPPGTVRSYNWVQDATYGRFKPISFSGLVDMVLHLNYVTGTNFSGTAYTSPNPTPISGSYTITGP